MRIIGAYKPLLSSGPNGIDISTIVCPQYIKIAGESDFLPVRYTVLGGMYGDDVRNVVLPGTLKKIDENTFRDMTRITKINIGEECTEIDANSISDKYSLTEIYIDSRTIVEKMYNGYLTLLICDFDDAKIYIRQDLYREEDNITINNPSNARYVFRFNAIKDGYAEYVLSQYYGSDYVDPEASEPEASEPEASEG